MIWLMDWLVSIACMFVVWLVASCAIAVVVGAFIGHGKGRR